MEFCISILLWILAFTGCPWTCGLRHPRHDYSLWQYTMVPNYRRLTLKGLFWCILKWFLLRSLFLIQRLMPQHFIFVLQYDMHSEEKIFRNLLLFNSVKVCWLLPVNIGRNKISKIQVVLWRSVVLIWEKIDMYIIT